MPFSGAALANPAEILCPTTQEPCTARETLVALYRTNWSDKTLPGRMRVDELHPFGDEAKLQLKLTEHRLAALAIGCSGTQGDVCPVRERMSQSPARVTAVGLARGAISKLRGIRNNGR